MSARTPEARRIVNLIIDDRQSVRPHNQAGKMGFDPFSQATETFDPFIGWTWTQADCIRPFACGQVFEALQTLHNRLSPDERREGFPDGSNP
jgi:hypothetical protein